MKKMQKCSNCFKIKPVSEFYKKLTRYQSRCKACNTEVCKGYRNEVTQKKHDKRIEFIAKYFNNP